MKQGFKKLEFEGGYGAEDEQETPLRGYRGQVTVELSDGTRFPVTFYDPVRLQQTLEDDAAAGSPFLAEPGLIVLPVVDLEHMEKAARALCEQGYFDHLKALPR